jgi:hypothetical protein
MATTAAGKNRIMRATFFGGRKMHRRLELALLVFFTIISLMYWAAVIEYLMRVGVFGHLGPGTY